MEKYHLLATNAVNEKKKSVAGCRIIHNKSRAVDAHPHFKYAELKEEKVRI